MTIDRKSFLKAAGGSGLALFFGGIPFNSANAWSDRGVGLTSVRRSSLVMGSVAQFEVIAETEAAGYEAIRRAVAVLRDLERKLSMYDPASEASKLGMSAGKKPITLSEDARNVLKYSLEMWGATGGVFDITVEPAMRRWGFRKDPDVAVTRPSETELRELERLIGSDKLRLEGNRAYLEQEGMAVDLGGVAGGYALDRAIEAMRRADVAAGFINLSGDIHCFGSPAESVGWPVHILDPHSRRPMEEPVYLHDEALSTSGTYENRRSTDRESKESWGHLLLPASAEPYEFSGSVTAIHPSAMTADAWSTAGLLGAEKSEGARWVVQV